MTARRKAYSSGYTYFNLSEKFFGGLIDPILNFDHFQMSERAFPARPFAGYTVITALFENSAGAFRTRDSLGDESFIGAGELHATASGRGVMLEEAPVEEGVISEGIQLYVNLSTAGKKAAPQSFHLKRAEIPVFKPNSALQVRVLLGKHGGVESPRKLPEPFTLLDGQMKMRMSFSPRILADHGALLYVVSGKVRVTANDEISMLEKNQAIGAQSDEKDHEWLIEALEDAHWIYASGKSLHQPIVTNGPFAMNTQADLDSAVQAYQRGEMGKVASGS